MKWIARRSRAAVVLVMETTHTSPSALGCARKQAFCSSSATIRACIAVLVSCKLCMETSIASSRATRPSSGGAAGGAGGEVGEVGGVGGGGVGGGGEGGTFTMTLTIPP